MFCCLIFTDKTSQTYNSQWPDSLRMCSRHVDSTNPGRSNLVFRSDRTRKL